MKVYLVIVGGSSVYVAADKVEDVDKVLSFYHENVLVARFYEYNGWSRQ